jgi:two-component sensor histidine kinase
MALSLVAPAAIFMIMLAGIAYRESQQRYEQQLIATTRALAVATDRQIAQGQATLQALSISPALRSGDFTSFEKQARDVAPDRRAWIVLSNSDRQLVNTLAAPGTRLPPAKLPDPVWAALSQGSPRVSNLTRGTLIGRYIIAIDTPVVIGGRLYVLSFIQEPRAFESIFQAQDLPISWTGAIIDGNSVLIARSRSADQFRGRKALPELRAAMSRSLEGVVRSYNLERIPTLSAFSRSPVNGWTFVVGVPRSELNSSIFRSMFGLVLATLALLVIGISLALAFSMQISRQVRSLAMDARAITDNQIVESRDDDLEETAQVREALHRASLALRAREAEQALAAGRQEVMINELNHRVKNTLAMVQSLARQSFGALDVTPGLASFNERLLALSRAHDLLTERTWLDADLADVVSRTLEPYGEQARTSGPSVLLAPNAAVTLSMVLHELANNAVKYGSLSRPQGRVDVTWNVHRDQRLTIIWREQDGPAVRRPEQSGFGARLISASIRHEFAGTVLTDYLPGGLVCSMTLPLGERLTGAATAPLETSPGDRPGADPPQD